MNAQEIIDQVAHIASRYYGAGEELKQAHHHRQMLEQRVRELVAIINTLKAQNATDSNSTR